MVTPEVAPLAVEQLDSDARRLINLLDGAIGLLAGDCSAHAVHTAREVISEARGVAGDARDTIESLVARQADKDRAELARRQEQARITASGVAVSR